MMIYISNEASEEPQSTVAKLRGDIAANENRASPPGGSIVDLVPVRDYEPGFHSAQPNRINSKFQLPKEPTSNPMSYNPNNILQSQWRTP